MRRIVVTLAVLASLWCSAPAAQAAKPEFPARAPGVGKLVGVSVTLLEPGFATVVVRVECEAPYTQFQVGVMTVRQGEAASIDNGFENLFYLPCDQPWTTVTVRPHPFCCQGFLIDRGRATIVLTLNVVDDRTGQVNGAEVGKKIKIG